MQRHRPGGRAAFRIRAAGLVLLTGYLLFAGWLTLRPLAVQWVDPANVTLFATIQADLRQGPVDALRSMGGDLLLLAPLGVLLPLAAGARGRRIGSFARTVFVAGMISMGIEALRSAVPGQVANVDSVVLNTAGVAVVHLLLYPLLRRCVRRMEEHAQAGAVRAEEGAQGRTPRTARVGIAPRTDASRRWAPYV